MLPGSPRGQPRIAWVDSDAGLRIVVGDDGPVIEAVAGVDAMGLPKWRRVDTADPSEVRQRKLEGWKAITVAAGLQPTQWKMVHKASRRNIDPLLVFYDGFDRPFSYEVIMRDWLARQVRSARAFDLEKLARRHGAHRVRAA
ncbi:hypothetical protein [Sorangium sp. So ce1151]|uniref:hypothetical protein n=1 Tax=Sorangium sp. So ce1151 TaxID=3133332 RepID=UPI003F63BAE0